jgi:hypothetical protein
MANAELKTKLSDASVNDFLDTVADEGRRADCFRVKDLMAMLTGEEPGLWGRSIIGFGSVHLKYATGRELDWMIVGFSSRKTNLTLYIVDGFDRYDELMAKLGKHKTGKSCLYIKSLADIDMNVLEDLITLSIEHVKGGALERCYE